MTNAKQKKVSIREFVSNEELTFQIYLLKYSGQLKDIEEKTSEEIQEQFNVYKEKRLAAFEKDLLKFAKNDTAVDAISKNIEYMTNLKAPIDKDDIEAQFYQAKSTFIDYLQKEIIESNQQKHKDMLEYAKDVEISSKASKEKFGVMLLLIIKNLSTMPSFSGYSENWKTDFFSNAIEKTLLYVHNFDENLVSKRSGVKSNAFAYITQICFNAFVNIINIRKKESEFLKDEISFESANLDGMKVQHTNLESTFEHINSTEYKVKLKSKDDVLKVLSETITYIKESNEIIDRNSSLVEEIKHLDKSTSLEEKNNDYVLYIEELKNQIKPKLENNLISTIRLIKHKDSVIHDISIPESDINIIISDPVQKIKPLPKVEEEIPELEDLDEEWY